MKSEIPQQNTEGIRELTNPYQTFLQHHTKTDHSISFTQKPPKDGAQIDSERVLLDQNDLYKIISNKSVTQIEKSTRPPERIRNAPLKTKKIR